MIGFAQRSYTLFQQSSLNTKREIECLRSLQKKTEDEQKEWNSYKQKEEARLEREDQKLKNLAKDLAEKQRQYEVDRRTLQELIDLHASRGIDVSQLRKHGRFICNANKCSCLWLSNEFICFLKRIS